MTFDLVMDGDVIVEFIDCGCVLRTYPNGYFTDSGCRFHMPHRTGEAFINDPEDDHRHEPYL